MLLKYYKGRVQEMCRAFGFPAKVQAAAIAFLSRFYLRHSPLEHDVKDIMLACLYLAGKVMHPQSQNPCLGHLRKLLEDLVCHMVC